MTDVPKFTMTKQTVTRTEILVDIPATGLPLEQFEELIETARKQYHRDMEQITPPGWLHVDTHDGKLRLFYIVRSDAG